jgi:glycosyltransferase involved in cell wall biosynthesis
MVYIPENGIDLNQFLAAPKSWDAPLRLIFVGRLVPYKGADMVLEACQECLKDGRATLDIVGDGPDMPLLQTLSRRYQIEHAVTFHGWKSHAEVVGGLQQANALVFPSVREFGGGVVLEAMACGAVPVVADYGGPAELVTANTGFAIPIDNRVKMVEDLRACIEAMVGGAFDLAEMSRRASERVEHHYSWNRKAGQIERVYRWLIDPAGAAPVFGFLDED